MKIATDRHVTVAMTITLDDGTVAESFDEGDPFTFIVGGRQVPAGLEQALMGLDVGQSTSFLVEPETGFGTFDHRLVRDMPRNAFPPEAVLEVGTAFQVDGPQGQVVPFRVVAVDGDTIQADFNHPLAGRTVRFDVTVLTVREATADELAAAPGRSMVCGSCKGGCGGCGEV